MNFSSSTLVRLLGSWAPDEGRSSRQDIAEHLAQWLNVADAMSLHALHQTMQPQPMARHRAPRPDLLEMARRDAESVRTAQAQAIQRLAAGSGVPDGEPDVRSLHQTYLDQQRRMAQAVDALRERVRQVLQQASVPLAQLALLDAAMDRALSARSHKLLTGVPMFIERRAEQLRQQGSMEGWTSALCRDMQTALLSELDVRLQPVQGLLEALATSLNDLKTQTAA